MNAEPTPTQLLEAIVNLTEASIAAFGRIELKLNEHDRRFDEHDRRFDEHDRQFEIVNRRLGRIETRVEYLERNLPA